MSLWGTRCGRSADPNIERLWGPWATFVSVTVNEQLPPQCAA